MKLLKSLLNLFNTHKNKLPEDMDSIDEIKAKAQDLMEQHGDKLDQVKDKIPGDADDKIIDSAKDALKK